jgi:hypothetical protein
VSHNPPFDDLLELNGDGLRREPLAVRKATLETTVRAAPRRRTSKRAVLAPTAASARTLCAHDPHFRPMKSFSAGKIGWAGLVTLALAGAVAVASPAAADPTGVALVEGLTGNPSGVEFMDYVRAGQVIRLGPHQTMVLSYMASCVRETITGGTVTVGTQRSEVQSGHVRRIEGHCYSGRMELTGEEAHVGGRVFRGPAH